jgi:cyclopropane-fatty-acyl-phospholipid synthase
VNVATAMSPVILGLFGGTPPVRFEFWDSSAVGPEVRADAPGYVVVRSPDVLRRLLYAPGELGLARAYVAGELSIEGDVHEVLGRIQASQLVVGVKGAASVPRIVRALRQVGAWGPPLAPPPEELAPRGLRHSIGRDKQAVSHHYDVGNEFYALVLGESMTYSCARFVGDDVPLAVAQAAKHELICRKLGLAGSADHTSDDAPRLLDVGCGWGSMAIHAATTHGARVVGVTISDEQAALARIRVKEAGVDDRVEIRLQDYRLVDDGPFDAISSVGMAEHVGHRNMTTYFTTLRALLRPGGRMLNHAISKPGGSKLATRGFMNRYVFPDGELLDVADTVRAMELAGFEVRDVESLREHYARTLRHWVDNLQHQWERAVELVGERRARVWLLYMSGSINSFERGTISLHQVLGVVPHADGRSDMPATRADWH